MSVRQCIMCAVVVLVVLVTYVSAPTFQPTLSPASQDMTTGKDETALGQLPLQFEVNEGQADAAARFLAHGPGYNLLLGSDEAVLALSVPEPGRSPAVLRLQFVGAAAQPQIAGVGQLPGVVNYYLGGDPAAWRVGIPTYRQVRYQGIYPGVDLVFFGNQRQLEHDFVVAPGGDPDVITLRAQGADALRIDRAGDLILGIAGGTLRLLKPFIYQEVEGVRQPIGGGFVLKGGGEFGFQVAAYDASQPLIIDPVLSYSTYFGGAGDDYAYGIAVDAAENVYITGATNSTDFPLMNPSQPGFGGGGINCPSDEVPSRLCYDAFVTKLNASGTALVYSTYLGLPGDDEARGIAVDPDGNAYITGQISLSSESLPDMYIYKYMQLARLDALGAVTHWEAFGSIDSKGLAIAVDSDGRAYVTGEVASSDFPTTAGAIQIQREELIDAFVSVYDSTASQWVYSTYLGGDGEYCGLCYSSGRGIAVDGAGMIYVTGQAAASFPTTANAYQRTFDGLWKAFVVKIDPTLAGTAALVYSTLLGGTTLSDFGYGIALDANGKVYVTGATQTDDFPTTPGAYDRSCGTDGICNTTDNMVCDYVLPGQLPICHVDAKSDVFVVKLDLSQSGAASLLYSTYIGGGGHESGYGIGVDPSGNVYVTGKTGSPNFPLVSPVQGTIGGKLDAFALRLNPAGSSLDYSTFLGGGGDDVGEGVAADTAGNAYVTGWTGSMAFPTANPLQPQADGWEAFITKISVWMGAPASLSATATSQTQINLSWSDSSSDESDFHIERSPDGSTGWTEIGSVGANITNYNSAGLSCGTTYHYRVRGHRHSDGQFSAYSNTAFATTQGCVFGKSGPSNGGSGVSAHPTLSWSSVTNATSYEYCIDTINNDACDVSWASTGSATSKALSGLTSGATYYWQVRALNNATPITYADSGTWWSFSTQFNVFLPIVIK